MLKVPLRNPRPDFEEFRKVIKGEKPAKRVHFVELLADQEIVNFITENFLREKAITFSSTTKECFLRQQINWWYRMGYDYIRVAGGLEFFGKERRTKDTALLSRKERSWVEEGKGVINSWEDFEKYPWPDVNEMDYSSYEFVSRNLPEGMKMMVCPSSGVFEISSEALLGFEGMSYLLYDDPALVEAVFNKVGEAMYNFYKNMVELQEVEGFFQGDDLGFKTSMIVSPEVLRRLVLPWHKRFASLAHRYNKMYWFHCCGNVLMIMKDLIEEVKIDAFHSFQDTIIPVGEFKRKYGEKIAVFGGVDVDKLCRLEKSNLRKYVRRIVEECMPYRYALGSGNSIANYVPVRNYLIMLDEGLRWKNTNSGEGRR